MFHILLSFPSLLAICSKATWHTSWANKNVCSSSVKLSKNSEGEWYCQACKERNTIPYYYYTVSLRIKDITGEHSIDLFGDSVTTLFGIKAEEYSKKLVSADEGNTDEGNTEEGTEGVSEE